MRARTGESSLKKIVAASRPPAEAPIPTIGKRAGPPLASTEGSLGGSCFEPGVIGLLFSDVIRQELQITGFSLAERILLLAPSAGPG
jgi:hypothetical protein